MNRFLSEIQEKYPKLAKIVKISILFNRLVFPLSFNRFSQPLTVDLFVSELHCNKRHKIYLSVGRWFMSTNDEGGSLNNNYTRIFKNNDERKYCLCSLIESNLIIIINATPS